MSDTVGGAESLDEEYDRSGHVRPEMIYRRGVSEDRA
jgi:hypothetical protein